MIFISAQPDEQIFIWQLMLVIRNLKSLGVQPSLIHVLVGYNLETGLNPEFASFIEHEKDNCNFFLYPDKRSSYSYVSTIRPHILKQHFDLYPELKNEIFFYHDSDVLFSRLPCISNELTNKTCFVSDTRSYLDLKYIRKVGNEELLEKMLEVVGLDKETLERESENSGGAQYILNEIDSTFWEKIESDSEELFKVMQRFNDQEIINHNGNENPPKNIQSWCADMWAILWNLWLDGKKVKIHSEMDFSWATSNIDEWKEKAILHYSGDLNKRNDFFNKTKYKYFPPWFDTGLKFVSNQYCGFKVVEQITKIREEFLRDRIVLKNSFVVLYGKSGFHSEEECKSKFYVAAGYLSRFVKVDIYLLYDVEIYRYDPYSLELHLTNSPEYSNYKEVIFFPINWFLEEKALLTILQTKNSIWRPVSLLNFDFILYSQFKAILDIKFLKANNGKCVERNWTEKYPEISVISIMPYMRNLHLSEIIKYYPLKLSVMEFNQCYASI